MSYKKQTWAVSELVKPEKMRHIEQGIVNNEETLSTKITNPLFGSVGYVLTKTANGVEWREGGSGAKKFVCTFTIAEDSIACDKTPDEIISAKASGKIIMGVLPTEDITYMFQLVVIDSSHISFFSINYLNAIIMINANKDDVTQLWSWSDSITNVIDIPEAPESPGTYTLKCIVAGGEITYLWVSE